VDGAFDLRTMRRGDVIVIPGVFATRKSSIARLLAREDVRHVISLLPPAVEKGALVAASCSATFLAGSFGVLDGKRATTTWWLMPFFQRRYPAVDLRPQHMVVDAGVVMTAGAAFAHADLMLAVVARVASPPTANLVARYLLFDARRAQSRYMVMEHLQTFDPLLQTLEDFVTTNIERQVALAELARVTATSPRTLARSVAASVRMTPQEFVQRIRVATATHLLEQRLPTVQIRLRACRVSIAPLRQRRRHRSYLTRQRVQLRALEQREQVRPPSASTPIPPTRPILPTKRCLRKPCGGEL
jgi:transcriptional regulator GlxA family with amidase domain